MATADVHTQELKHRAVESPKDRRNCHAWVV